jgi:Tol biopolymer transport system component/beta-lactamase regulating signal transducer with metallopeptidase domain
MIATISWDRLDAVGFEVARHMLSMLWQSTVLLSIVGLLVWWLRRNRAAIRHRLWTLALLATPLLPLFTWVAAETGTPHAPLAVIPSYASVTSFAPGARPILGTESGPREDAGASVSTPAPPSDLEPSDHAKGSEQANVWNDDVPVAAQPVPRRFRPWAIVMILYVTGLAFMLALVAIGRLRLGHYVRHGRIVTDPRLTGIIESARRRIGLERGCVIVELDGLHAPLTFRTMHPVVALPTGLADELGDDELRTIALHELAHVARNDPLVLNFASIIRAVLFFHPLVWLAAREIATLAEQSADTVVLEATDAPLPYAKMLTRLTERLTHRMLSTELAVGIVFSKSALLRRIEAILSTRTEQLRHLSSGALVMITILIPTSLLLATAVPLTAPTSTLPRDEHGKGMTIRHVWTVPGSTTVYAGGVSPDGRLVSVVDWTAGDLAVHDLNASVTRKITSNSTWASTGGWNEESVISPDGTRIAYHWFDEKEDYLYELRVVDMDGTNMRIVHHDPEVPWARPFDWSPDGTSLLVHFDRAKSRVDKDSKVELAIVSVEDSSAKVLSAWTRAYRGPTMASFSPDGRYVAYDRGAVAEAGRNDVYVIDVNSGREQAVVVHPADDRYLGWAPDGRGILFASNRTDTTDLWMHPLRNGEPAGQPVLLKRNFEGRGVGFDRNGSYYYVVDTASQNVHLSSLDDLSPGATRLASTRFVNSAHLADWSPDGDRLAYKVRSNYRNLVGAIAIRDLETGRERVVEPQSELVFGRSRRRGRVHFAPDGRSLLISASPKDQRSGFNIFRIDVATGGTEIVVEDARARHPLLSPDGQTVFYLRNWRHLLRHDLATGGEQELLQTNREIYGLDLSPDGTMLALCQKNSLTVLPSNGGELREVVHLRDDEVSAFGSRFVTWMPNGRELLFSKRSNQIWRVDVRTGAQEQLGSPVQNLLDVAVHPDGRQLAVSTFEQGSELWVMENLLPEN